LSISDVLAEYERIREKNSIEQRRRTEDAYKKIPKLEGVHRRIKELQQKRISCAFEDTAEIEELIRSLRKESEELLVESGLGADYLDPVYSCHVCRDAGVLGSAERCDCFKKKVLEDKLSEARLLDGGVSFERFDINIFDNTPFDNGKSQRDYMLQYKKISENYADSFPGCPPVFLMSGGTGLGKTYLSKCIMRRVIERGHTAAFYTAYRLFSLFHQHRLGEDIDLRPIFEVPLLVIDDIGTEPMTRNVTVEYLFDLINERSSLHTVIVTNLPFHDIKERFGERIHSRLMDKNASVKILLRGKDIRY
jgi:DNA replication protein DnaC